MEKIFEEFEKYVSNYTKENDFYNLKTEHTYRVTNLCERIAKSLNLTQKEIEIAVICGLLHDISRFEQFRKYGSFYDIETIDHGDFSYDILKEGLISNFCTKPQYIEIILKAVKYHNKFRIPKGLTEKEELFAKIVRDADKLDKLYLATRETEFLTFDIRNDDISDTIYNKILSNESIKWEEINCKADEACIRFGYTFDFYFKESYSILKKEDYMERIIDGYLNKKLKPETRKKLEIIKEHINNYITERIDE